MDREILLAFINSQGTGLSWIVIAFFAMVVCLVLIKATRYNDFQNGINQARREGLDNLQVTLAKIVHEQQETKRRIESIGLGE
jgi:hypothetical protein